MNWLRIWHDKLNLLLLRQDTLCGQAISMMVAITLMEYQFNNYIISEKGDLFKPISNVTIDKDKGINWKGMDIFSKLPIFRY